MLKIYGSLLCPDCVKCCEDLRTAQVAFDYQDFSKNLLALKEFLSLRDSDPVFASLRETGKIGIPCIVREDGSVTLDWTGFMPM